MALTEEQRAVVSTYLPALLRRRDGRTFSAVSRPCLRTQSVRYLYLT